MGVALPVSRDAITERSKLLNHSLFAPFGCAIAPSSRQTLRARSITTGSRVTGHSAHCQVQAIRPQAHASAELGVQRCRTVQTLRSSGSAQVTDQSRRLET